MRIQSGCSSIAWISVCGACNRAPDYPHDSASPLATRQLSVCFAVRDSAPNVLQAVLRVASGRHSKGIAPLPRPSRGNPPEIGDIGPNSELLCKQLAERFPNADLAVEGRSIRSPTEVSVGARVDGKPVSLRYLLLGYQWRPEKSGRLAEVLFRQSPFAPGPSMSNGARKP
jgi:hypothetical protein